MKEKISELLQGPYPTGCRKLRGAPNAYRLRVGKNRILYAIVSGDEILVFRIAQPEATYWAEQRGHCLLIGPGFLHAWMNRFPRSEPSM